MKVLAPQAMPNGETKMVFPEKQNRTPRRLKGAGAKDFLDPKQNETKQDSITAYLEHSDSEIDEAGVAEAKAEENAKRAASDSSLDRAHARLGA